MYYFGLKLHTLAFRREGTIPFPESPSGQRYELCRSVHAEMNAIISAARRDTLGATLYLAGREAASGELLHDATSCSMCRRLIINAGIDRVVIRNTQTGYSVVHVEDWIREDDSLPVPQDTQQA